MDGRRTITLGCTARKVHVKTSRSYPRTSRHGRGVDRGTGPETREDESDDWGTGRTLPASDPVGPRVHCVWVFSGSPLHFSRLRSRPKGAKFRGETGPVQEPVRESERLIGKE